eukprot:COSAG05_NODE_11195_length_525_cov_1.654930_2_plen_101_part_01
MSKLESLDSRGKPARALARPAVLRDMRRKEGGTAAETQALLPRHQSRARLDDEPSGFAWQPPTRYNVQKAAHGDARGEEQTKPTWGVHCARASCILLLLLA